jgi:hypothetical protein
MARFSFVTAERVEALLMGATRLGNEVPLHNDDVHVSNFDRNGSVAAIERARARNDKRR